MRIKQYNSNSHIDYQNENAYIHTYKQINQLKKSFGILPIPTLIQLEIGEGILVPVSISNNSSRLFYFIF
ncbi:unnamed protein product [Paramecium octaurelia]|uniref:Uncharacterized protein n=1 Tax=Paramecium octaurelia TaxID=43137 RepID=A0A8S1XCZ0_PAROT|nr:unnamed protein product [Paramecium octaurelia]